MNLKLGSLKEDLEILDDRRRRMTMMMTMMMMMMMRGIGGSAPAGDYPQLCKFAHN